MDKLSVQLKNCYGIGHLDFIFEFQLTNTILVYAPNGTMKSSFAKTFKCFSTGLAKEAPADRIYPDRIPEYNILVDNAAIQKEAICVIDAENSSYDSSDKITNFIASRELKERYDSIYGELDKIKKEFLKKLKTVSQSTDCEGEFVSTFSQNTKDTFYSLLVSVADKIMTSDIKYDFRYNDIFDKKDNVKRFLEKNQSLLKQYFDNYQNILSHSTFFKKSENSFGTIQANEIVKATENNAFFDAGHKFILNGGKVQIKSSKSLKQLVEQEINNIISDATLKETFDKVDKAIGANAELRSFKMAIEKNNLLLIELREYDKFKKKVWMSYLSELKDESLELVNLYNGKKIELEKLLTEAKKEIKIWNSIIDLFNTRFHVPFTVKLANQEDVILKQEIANLLFEYKDEIDEPPAPQDKDSLLKILSKGEQRAYYILQLLFDIEARKLLDFESLLIFDDIADSFDYKNKYAIIEYLKDIHESSKFKSIILTHNFDFYRTVFSRLGIKRTSVYMTIKNEHREIKLEKGEYRDSVFTYFIKKANEPKIFISLIPFIRNIIEYTESEDCSNYMILTSCLHWKSDTESIICKSILDIFQFKSEKCKSISIAFGEKKLSELVFETAQTIIDDHNINDILLENKLVLSIAIRLKAECYMLDRLPGFDYSKKYPNQTRMLFNEYKVNGIDKDLRKIQILDKINLMTPENIHMNAFMYEPLIDISLHHLKSLYSDIDSL